MTVKEIYEREKEIDGSLAHRGSILFRNRLDEPDIMYTLHSDGSITDENKNQFFIDHNDMIGEFFEVCSDKHIVKVGYLDFENEKVQFPQFIIKSIFDTMMNKWKEGMNIIPNGRTILYHDNLQAFSYISSTGVEVYLTSNRQLVRTNRNRKYLGMYAIPFKKCMPIDKSVHVSLITENVSIDESVLENTIQELLVLSEEAIKRTPTWVKTTLNHPIYMV